jgi:hypothetical protein
MLWSDNHNDIGLVVSLWGSIFSLNQLSVLIVCPFKLFLNASPRALNLFAQLSESAALF